MRAQADVQYFAATADRLSRLCHSLAERLSQGGRLIAMGRTAQARSDARHVAVEFVHPVIVGKRALPAIALTGENGALTSASGRWLSRRTSQSRSGRTRRPPPGSPWPTGGGCMTVAFGPIGAEWTLEPPVADPFVRQELTETAYHLLWELVHVFFEHRGLFAGRNPSPSHDLGPSSFLYPFLAGGEGDTERIIEDVRRSIRHKANESGACVRRRCVRGATR